MLDWVYWWRNPPADTPVVVPLTVGDGVSPLTVGECVIPLTVGDMRAPEPRRDDLIYIEECARAAMAQCFPELEPNS